MSKKVTIINPGDPDPVITSDNFKDWVEKDVEKQPVVQKKTGRGRPKHKIKPKTLLSKDEVEEMERLSHRAAAKKRTKQAQEAHLREKMGLASDAPIPKMWLQGGPKFDKDLMQRFCEYYAQHNLLSKAAAQVGISPKTVALHRKNNPMFQEMIDEAKLRYRDKIAETIYERAVTGVEEPIIGGMARDQVVAHKRVYSDRLLELEAKRVDHAYRERGGVEINTGGGVLVVKADNLSEDDWAKKYGEIEPQSEGDK